ncbi:response regulator transcription factor [Paenibacillus kobensis]|uniref:response regulator transcription factor n=1 Tax=Paenibacillus kobensis TaxID=59841 RepID=UPI000FD720C6|nr:response regulator [Paenibacillus kobensis]
MNVILVDDEEMIRRGMHKMMMKLGLPVQIVGSYGSGADAWSRIEGMTEGELDLLITDIKMPFMDGLQLIERARAKLPNMAIIVLSGFSEFEYARMALRFGVRDYLLKPVDKNHLHNIISQLIEERSAERTEAATRPAEGASPSLESTTVQPEDGDHYMVEHIRSTLDKTYDQPLDLDKLAQTAGMSASYISRLFRQKMNKTMTEYVIGLRIERAKELLTDNPALKNYEISQLVGYHDPVYFNKLFKKEVGVTPKDYKVGRR